MREPPLILPVHLAEIVHVCQEDRDLSHPIPLAFFPFLTFLTFWRSDPGGGKGRERKEEREKKGEEGKEGREKGGKMTYFNNPIDRRAGGFENRLHVLDTQARFLGDTDGGAGAGGVGGELA